MLLAAALLLAGCKNLMEQDLFSLAMYEAGTFFTQEELDDLEVRLERMQSMTADGDLGFGELAAITEEIVALLEYDKILADKPRLTFSEAISFICKYKTFPHDSDALTTQAKICRMVEGAWDREKILESRLIKEGSGA